MSEKPFKTKSVFRNKVYTYPETTYSFKQKTKTEKIHSVVTDSNYGIEVYTKPFIYEFCENLDIKYFIEEAKKQNVEYSLFWRNRKKWNTILSYDQMVEKFGSGFNSNKIDYFPYVNNVYDVQLVFHKPLVVDVIML